ncbi:apolipoprotein N-acyltransferase [Desulfonauticus submarinus]
MKRIFYLILISFCCFFSYPNPYFCFPPFLFLLLGSLHVLAIEKRNYSKFVYIYSSFGYAVVFYWIYYPCYKYGNIPFYLSCCFPILIGFYLSIYIWVYYILIRLMRRYLSFFWLGIFAAGLWMALEIIREYFLSGFPWPDLALIFSPYPFFLQCLKFIGAKGFSFFVVLITFFLINRKYVFVSFSIFMILILLNIFSLLSVPPTISKLKVRLVQGNIDQEHKWDKEYQENTVHTYMNLSLKNVYKNKKLDLVIWPETCMPFYFQERSKLSNIIRKFVRDNKIYLLFGSPGYKFISEKKYLLFNRAYLLDDKGDIIGIYDKQKLVPFGEYLPFNFLYSVFRFFYTGVGDFSPGLLTDPLKMNNLALGVLICYEAIFSHLVEDRVNKGSEILINISNDAWFGDSSAPYQHLFLTTLRAIEQQRYILRCTNSGITAIISNKGVVLKKIDLFKKGYLDFIVYTIKENSFFNKYFYYIYSFPFIILIIFFLKILFLGGAKDVRFE